MFDIKFCKHFTSSNLSKASLAERGIKTIKGRVMKAMHARNSHVWYDMLQKITNAYNSAVHSAIGMPPNKVTDANEVDVFMRLHEFTPKQPKQPKIKKHKMKIPTVQYTFQIGDAVKLAFTRYIFQREYSQRWTSEVFLYVIDLQKKTYSFIELRILIIKKYKVVSRWRKFKKCTFLIPLNIK